MCKVFFFFTRDVRTSDIPSKMNKKLAFPVNHHVKCDMQINFGCNNNQIHQTN